MSRDPGATVRVQGLGIKFKGAPKFGDGAVELVLAEPGRSEVDRERRAGLVERHGLVEIARG